MIGSRLAHYRIVSKLGAGGMGEVYLAEDTKLDRQVALKILPAELAGDVERLARFEREARTVAALNHPGIVTIYSVETGSVETGSVEPGPVDVAPQTSSEAVQFLTMELVDGETLDKHVPPGGLALEKFFALAVPLADAVAEAHARGITHRDLKPANVMVDERGRVKVLDFGLAKPVRDGDPSSRRDGDATELLTQEGLVIGTVHYMSPEQARGEPADPRSDVFSLGVLLYELATGRRPFDGTSSVEVLSSLLRDEPPLVTEIKDGLPNHLGRIVRRCLEKDPAKRYQSALEVRNELESLRSEGETSAGDPEERVRADAAAPNWLRLGVPAVLVLALLAWLATRNREPRAEEVRPAAALEELLELVDAERYAEAFFLHRRLPGAEARLPEATEALAAATQLVAMTSTPAGAEVSIRPYGEASDWLALGRTPLADVTVPRGFLAVKIEPVGGEPEGVYELAGELEAENHWRLPSTPSPDGMTWIPPGTVRAASLSQELPADAIELPGFFIDRFEVTNADYARFVADGGYRRQQLWPPFLEKGRAVAWSAGITRFVDATGRPGPAGWELGAYPEDAGAMPVTGVSWFEAAAYAAWAGNELPSLWHWLQTARLGASPRVVPASNFGDRLLPADPDRGLGVWGTRDLAGNAVEWSRTGVAGRGRLLLGGAWNEPSYNYFSAYDARSPWERRVEFGFRMMREVAGSKPATPEEVEARPERDLLAEAPVDDRTFEIYRAFHDFSQGPLEPAVVAERAGEHWREIRVEIDAGHGGERLPIVLLLPTGSPPPYSVGVLMAGANALRRSSSAEPEGLVSFDAVDFLLRSGRAVAIPVLLGTYERQDGFELLSTEDTIALRDHVLAWTKEIRRTVDYLVSREDLRDDRLFFVGSSLGGVLAPVMLALEPRFQAAYLRLAGLPTWRQPGEVDSINFASRVRVPTLIVNGRYDRLLPLETSQKGLLRWLGTAEADKKLVLFDVGHAPPRPRNAVIREVLTWADRVLGPVD